eukprot:superscaffoldBa00008835_g23661
MDPAETDLISVFQPLIHPNDSDGEQIIKFFQSVHEEDPVLAMKLMASRWETVEHEAPFSVLPSSHPASKPANLGPASPQIAPWMACNQQPPQHLPDSGRPLEHQPEFRSTWQTTKPLIRSPALPPCLSGPGLLLHSPVPQSHRSPVSQSLSPWFPAGALLGLWLPCQPSAQPPEGLCLNRQPLAQPPEGFHLRRWPAEQSSSSHLVALLSNFCCLSCVPVALPGNFTCLSCLPVILHSSFSHFPCPPVACWSPRAICLGLLALPRFGPRAVPLDFLTLPLSSPQAFHLNSFALPLFNPWAVCLGLLAPPLSGLRLATCLCATFLVPYALATFLSMTLLVPHALAACPSVTSLANCA